MDRKVWVDRQEDRGELCTCECAVWTQASSCSESPVTSWYNGSKGRHSKEWPLSPAHTPETQRAHQQSTIRVQQHPWCFQWPQLFILMDRITPQCTQRAKGTERGWHQWHKECPLLPPLPWHYSLLVSPCLQTSSSSHNTVGTATGRHSKPYGKPSCDPRSRWMRGPECTSRGQQTPYAPSFKLLGYKGRWF